MLEEKSQAEGVPQRQQDWLEPVGTMDYSGCPGFIQIGGIKFKCEQPPNHEGPCIVRKDKSMAGPKTNFWKIEWWQK